MKNKTYSFDETAGIQIALKALPPELSHNTLEMEDIKENFQWVHVLSHSNIAAYHNLERDPVNGNYYLIMACCEGRGGGWRNNPRGYRSASRNCWERPGGHGSALGFRLALVPEQ